MTLPEFLARLEGVRKSGRGYVARCPSHDDRNASLSIGDGDRGIVVRCFAGCEPRNIVAGAGVTLRDLFSEAAPRVNRTPLRASNSVTREARPTVAPLSAELVERWHGALIEDEAALNYATIRLGFALPWVEDERLGLVIRGGRRWLAYPYRRGGAFTYAKLRSIDGQKSFLRVPAGIPSHLYGMDALEPSGTALLFEGERDAMAAKCLGLAAEVGPCGGAAVVSVPDGAGSATRPDVIDALATQREVFVALDNDNAGDTAARELTAALRTRGVRCRRFVVPGMKDLGELIAGGGVV